MRFTKLLNYSKTPAEKEIIQATEEALTSTFMELSLDWKAINTASKLGGDALQMQLVVPFPHYCDLTAFKFQPLKQAYIQQVLLSLKQGIKLPDLNKEQQEIIQAVQAFRQQFPEYLTTAGTDGQRFFWEPMFILSKSPLGRRLVVFHESGHATYLHPARVKHRNKNLWNIAIDFKVNHLAIRDLRTRGYYNAPELFIDHLGRFITLEEYASFIRDPYHPPPKLAALGRAAVLRRAAKPGYALIDDEIAGEELPLLYFAEPFLSKELQQAEAIYDHLWKQIPRCPCCNALAIYKKPKEYLKLEQELQNVKS